MKRPATGPKAASGRTSRHATGKERCSPRPAHQRPPRGPHASGQCVSTETENVHVRTMRHLRAFIGLLTALLLASVAHAVRDGLTTGLILGLALTILLLIASLRLLRVGSRRKPDDAAPPGIER
jgi:hypothetical protein